MVYTNRHPSILPHSCLLSFVFLGVARRWELSPCYTEKASPTRHRPERQHNARSNRRKQCSPNETKPYSKPTLPRKRQTTPTNGHTPRRLKPTHTRLTYTRMRPHEMTCVVLKAVPWTGCVGRCDGESWYDHGFVSSAMYCSRILQV